MSKHNQDSFSEWVEDYDNHLQSGLCLTGESREYYASKRIEWMGERISALGNQINSIMDFGCGNGVSAPLLARQWSTAQIHGIDICSSSIQKAREESDSGKITFSLLKDFSPGENMDLVYTNGVFHHIKPEERKDHVSYIYDSLVSGGLFAFWENNFINPGTRMVMKRIPFDQEAIPLSTKEACSMLATCGFNILHKDYLFILPGIFGRLRYLERFFTSVPLGGQYLILCRKP